MPTIKKTNVEIVYGMTNKAYHATEAIGSHTAINFGRSALHATAPPEDPTRAMEFGSACHKWILEEDDFYDEFAIPTLSLRSNAGKEMKRELQAQDLVIISQPDFDKIQEMKNALNRETKAYLDGREKEVSIFWQDPNGLSRKCRPDSILSAGDSKVTGVDYKTAADASPEGFKNAIMRYAYDQQAAWYVDGMLAADYDVEEFVFVVQEKKPPYANMVYKLNWRSIENAREKNNHAMKIILDYQQTGVAEPFNGAVVREIEV
jgi:hypothetical protein